MVQEERLAGITHHLTPAMPVLEREDATRKACLALPLSALPGVAGRMFCEAGAL